MKDRVWSLSDGKELRSISWHVVTALLILVPWSNGSMDIQSISISRSTRVTPKKCRISSRWFMLTEYTMPALPVYKLVYQ